MNRIRRAIPRKAGREPIETIYEPSVAPKWDSLRRDLLTDTTGIDLNYRQQPTDQAEDRHYVRNLIGTIGILSFFLLLVSTLSGVYINNGFMFALFVAFSLCVGVFTFISKRVIGLAIVYSAIGPVLWLLITKLNFYSAWIPLVISLALSAYLSIRIGQHYAAWLATNPKLIGDNQNQARDIWRNHYQQQDWKAWGILVAFAVFLIIFGSIPLTGFTKVLFFTIIFIGAVVFYSTRFYRISDTVKLCWEAVVSWFNYGRIQPIDPDWQEFEDREYPLTIPPILSIIGNFFPFLLMLGVLVAISGHTKHDTEAGLVSPVIKLMVFTGIIFILYFTYATIKTVYQQYGTIFSYPINPPGVFQSPSGRWIRRNLIATLIFFSLFCSILQFTQYAPVVFIYGSNKPWEESYSNVVKNEFSLTKITSKLYHYEPLSIKKLIELLPIDEVVLIKRLKSIEREQYFYHLQMIHYLNSGPGAWISLALDSVFSGHALGIWAVLVSFVTSLFLPIVIFSAVCLLMIGQKLRNYRTALLALESDECDWKSYVQRLQASPKGRDYIWLGTHATEDYPVLLHRDILREHAHFLGDSGSGKTALGIAPLLEQLIQAGDAAVIIDLKGDIALFETARIAAGDRFKFFTNEIGKATYAFNPFAQFQREHVSLNQICEVFLSALALEHGEGYGRSYYSRVARNLMSKTLAQYPDIASFAELKQRIESMATDGDQKRDAFELIAMVESLAGFPALNVTEETSPQVAEQAIFMPDVLDKSQVAYFWLPPAMESATAREIAKLAFHTLFTSAYQYQQRSHKQARVWVFIDEFQHVASLSFKVILQQARSMGIGLILANQTNADLRITDTDLKDTVQSNTRFKQYFAMGNPEEREELSKNSGETRYWDLGLGPRLMLNDLIEITDERQGSIVLISRGQGLTQYGGLAFPLRSFYHITEDEYKLRNTASWPLPTDCTLVNRHKERVTPGPSESERPLSVANILSEDEPPPTVSDKTQRSEWAQRLRSLYENRKGGKTDTPSS